MTSQRALYAPSFFSDKLLISLYWHLCKAAFAPAHQDASRHNSHKQYQQSNNCVTITLFFIEQLGSLLRSGNLIFEASKRVWDGAPVHEARLITAHCTEPSWSKKKEHRTSSSQEKQTNGMIRKKQDRQHTKATSSRQRCWHRESKKTADGSDVKRRMRWRRRSYVSLCLGRRGLPSQPCSRRHCKWRLGSCTLTIKTNE